MTEIPCSSISFFLCASELIFHSRKPSRFRIEEVCRDSYNKINITRTIRVSSWPNRISRYAHQTPGRVCIRFALVPRRSRTHKSTDSPRCPGNVDESRPRTRRPSDRWNWRVHESRNPFSAPRPANYRCQSSLRRLGHPGMWSCWTCPPHSSRKCCSSWSPHGRSSRACEDNEATAVVFLRRRDKHIFIFFFYIPNGIKFPIGAPFHVIKN